jgi:tRNA dimethylallyltransferase
MQKPARLICIVGQTATGKTDLAIRVAQAWRGEIICADSSTVRRDANIGTAKPTAGEQRLVRHHLLDIVGADEQFNAALFKEAANKAIAEITKRGNLPILVGGSGLYIDSVIYDYSFVDTVNADRELFNSLTRSELLERIVKLGIDLGEVDTHNKRRLIRLIETNGIKPSRNNIRSHTLLLGLHVEANELKRRIINRVDAMLDAGLENEVRQLIDTHGQNCEALKAISYAQWREYFSSNESVDQVRQKIIQANIKLARRQNTWFKRNKSIHWLTTPVNWLEVEDLITTFMNTDIPH